MGSVGTLGGPTRKRRVRHKVQWCVPHTHTRVKGDGIAPVLRASFPVAGNVGASAHAPVVDDEPDAHVLVEMLQEPGRSTALDDNPLGNLRVLGPDHASGYAPLCRQLNFEHI